MLEIRNITKVYRSKTGEEVKALDNVSIQFPENGMVFILGKSGSGKSTLLNVIGGLDSYDSGEFVIKGKSSRDFGGSDFDAYRNTFIGFIFQEYNVLDDFTVGANIALALELQGKKATDEAVNGILAQVDLLNFAKRKPNELSGGQKQRVAIARALVKEPEIIMADEPTGALDSNTGKQIFDTLKELSKQKLVLVVSHDRDFAERYADRIVELADGRIIEDVTKHEHKAEQISEGVHRISDNILRIEGGYRLTAKDLDMINAYLSQSKNDVLLSGDGRVNDELCSAAGISKDGATTVFEGTVPERDVKTKHYEKGQTKFIRSRLPMKNAVKMGSSSLKHKKFRLFMTILLSFIAFAMFGLSSSMAAYNKIEAATQSIVDTQIRSAAVTLGVRRTTIYDDGDMYSWHDQHAFTAEDIARLEAESGLKFVPVFTGSQYGHGDGGFDMSHIFKQYESNQVYTGDFSGLLTMSREQLPADYAVAGRLPEAAGEIAITEFFFRQLKQYGYSYGGVTIEGANLTMEAEGGANSIIGKKININRIGWNQLGDDKKFEFEIVGVVNTNFNYDRYAKLLPTDREIQEEETLMDLFLSREVEYERDFGFHGLAFAHIDDVEQMMRYMNSSYGDAGLGEYMSSYSSNMYFAAYVPADNEIDNDEPVDRWDISYVADAKALVKLSAENVLWKDGTAKTELGANEVLVSAQSLRGLMQNTPVAVDLNALDTVIVGLTEKIDAEYYMNERENNQFVMRAARNAAFVKYIKDQLSIPAVSQAVEKDVRNEWTWYDPEAPIPTSDIYNFWSEKWLTWEQWYGEAYMPQVENVTIKTPQEVEAEIYTDTTVQNGVFAIYGITRPETVTPEAICKLADNLSMGSVSIDSVYGYVCEFYQVNFIVSKGYHLAANYEDSFVQDFLSNRDMKNTEWLKKSDAERLQELSNNYYEVQDNPAKYGLDADNFHQMVYNIYFKLTGTDVQDLFASLDGLYYQLETRQWDENKENKTSYKKYTELTVVGMFFATGEGADNTVIGSAVYNDYLIWKEEQQALVDKENSYVPDYTEERVEHEPGMYAFAIAPIAANDAAAIQKLVEFSYADVDTTDFLYEMQNAVMYTLGNFNEMIEILSQVFVWVGLGLAVFASFLLMSFISTSISYKKREIGILRAVGARSSDVFKIFFSEAFIIALINFVLAIAASVTTVILLNHYMRSGGINITLLSFGPLQIGMMLGISVLVAVLASFLPVYRIAHKKPVDAIKDR